MATTPSAIASGAVIFQGLSDKLACMIYLLNLNRNMTAAQIAAGAVDFQGLSDKQACIISLIANGLGTDHGDGPPTGTPTAGLLYYDTTNKNIWAASGTQWDMMV